MQTRVLVQCCIYVLAASGCSKDAGSGGAQNATDISNSSGGGAVASSGNGSPASGGTHASTTAGAAGSVSTAGARGPLTTAGSTGPQSGAAAVAGSSAAPGAAGGGAAAPISADCPPVDSASGAGAARAVSVDAAKIVGTIRSLQGVHWDPGAAKGALSNRYVDMGVDMIRTHDGGGINGSGAGDMDPPGRGSMVPNLSADPSVATSYNFGPTDSMIKNMRAAGAEIYFRVGRSNISGSNTVPPDFDKYAEFVKHVVMHYNQGWANGFMYGIKYFEIWNEPDFLPFWAGTPDQYHELYKKIATAIKAVDPTALVGGPSNSTFNDKTGLRATFFKYLNDNKLPLDFYSFHKYTNKSQDPMDFARIAQSYRDELDKFGFKAAQIVNSEWESSLQGDILLGGEAGRAAFMADALIYMQNGPVDKSQSYMQIGATASKESLAFGAISKFKATPDRVCAQGGDDNGFGVMAGVSNSAPLLQVAIVNYQISKSLMGPIPGGNEESLAGLATMTYLDRRTFNYPDKNGYELTVKSIPEAWGDVTVKQYRIDASNSFTVMNTKLFKLADRPQGTIALSGSWVRAAASTNEPKGAAQGLDLIVVSGEAATTTSL